MYSRLLCLRYRTTDIKTSAITTTADTTADTTISTKLFLLSCGILSTGSNTIAFPGTAVRFPIVTCMDQKTGMQWFSRSRKEKIFSGTTHLSHCYLICLPLCYTERHMLVHHESHTIVLNLLSQLLRLHK